MKKPVQKKKKQIRTRPMHHHPAVLVSLLLAIVGLFFVTKTILAQQIIVIPNPPDTNYTTHKNLQLRTFGYITIPPLPSAVPTIPPPINGYCPDDVPRPTPVPGTPQCACIFKQLGVGIICENYNTTTNTCPDNGGQMLTEDSQHNQIHRCVYFGPNTEAANPNYDKYKQYADNPQPGDPKCYEACIAKPVIYLYPTRPTDVSVSIVTPGEITVSDPYYPSGGWDHVLAQPSGDLTYHGKQYSELFYETSVTKSPVPPTGMVIPTDQLKEQLTTITTKLGLKPSEQQEFLAYWLPNLYSLHSKYLLFSVLTPDQKEAVDHVTISPQPKTMIAFLAYFKPLDKPVAIAPLVLPQTPPVRIGFTAVEWGGTIDR